MLFSRKIQPINALVNLSNLPVVYVLRIMTFNVGEYEFSVNITQIHCRQKAKYIYIVYISNLVPKQTLFHSIQHSARISSKVTQIFFFITLIRIQHLSNHVKIYHIFPRGNGVITTCFSVIRLLEIINL